MALIRYRFSMRKYLAFWLFIFIPSFMVAQTDRFAEKSLNKVCEELTNTNGIRADFEGTESGVLLLKQEKFYFNNSHMQIWFDGKNQWSYIHESEEVNIVHPNLEDLQLINPYLILKAYKTNYNYSYKGNITKNGEKGYEIVLTPRNGDTYETIHFLISENDRPISIRIEQNGKLTSDINIISYKDNQHLDNHTFQFDHSKYPNVEIIDLR